MEPTTEFNDWEVLQPNSDSDSIPVDSVHEIDSRGLIHANYFSLDTPNIYGEEFNDNKSVKSDNSSWIDPGLEENPTRYLNREPAELGSDSINEQSDDGKHYDLFEGTENEKEQVSVELIGEKVEQKVEKMEDLGNFYSDSSGIESSFEKVCDCVGNSDVGSESNVVLRNDLSVSGLDKHENEAIEGGGETADGNETKNGGESEKRVVVWWKMPMEFLKYCVFKMSPVWTVSVAAAVVGFLILGRRLYKMKKKTRGLEFKVTVDDKKVSQVMSRAARLNEAFSVVKRVPVIRTSLPTVGVTTWPVMTTLR